MASLPDRRSGPLALAIVVALRCAATAHAGEPPAPPSAQSASLTQRERVAQARAQFRIGQGHFKRGHFEEAMDAFAAGYELHPLPLFLYNKAMSARRAGKLEQALLAYRRFIAIAPDAAERPEVDQRIDEIERALASVAPAPAQAAAETPPRLRPPDAGAAEASSTNGEPAKPPAAITLVMAAETPRPRGSHGRTKLIIGGALAGLGAISTGIGGAMAVLAGAANSELNHPVAGTVYDPSIETRRDRFQGAEVALFAFGGSALVAGTVLLGLGLRDRTAARTPVRPAALADHSDPATVFSP